MKEELEQYQVKPDRFWAALPLLGGDGYDDMEFAGKLGFRAIDGWGKDGYTLGSWPLIIIFFREREGKFEVVEYVEGDVNMWSCPTEEIREEITNELAFFHWKFKGCEWVKDYDSVEQLPEELKGPYRD